MRKILILCLVLTGQSLLLAQVNPTNRQLVLQAYWWDYWNTNYPNGWANYLTELAPRLADMGIDAIWIPPTIKNSGTNSVGYSPFDHYDLGDKFQKNSIKTRMGDKDELLRMVAVMHANGIDVIQDLVLNHVTNAGSANGSGGQDPAAMDDGQTNRFKNFRYVSFKTPASSESTAQYLARDGRFPKNWQNFYPNNNNLCCTNEINSPYWGPDISYESNAYGLSSNALYNPTQSADYMRNGMRNWLIWYKKQVGFDGLRLDAVKHFPSYVSEDMLWNLQYGAMWASGGQDMFAVGEWVGGTAQLDAWANAVQNRAGTFDFNLRFALSAMVSSNGAYDLSQIPSQQQQNRQRTVPFVNNHDTFRPQLSAQGNYTGWNTGSELSPHIEPNDSRNSAAHAIVLSIDGAPQLFFEDLFPIGYNGNRFNHLPTDTTVLAVDSDVANLIWCHQNLHFKDGAYFVRWQAPDALVIERSTKALIGITDNWNQWQQLNGVQTNWPDGTVLVDYSGANSNPTTVYGGGKVNISIPPCDGSANFGRRGYCVWAPQDIDTNYQKPAKNIVQEWEMNDDLGDRHANSLQQGGKLPNNSLECRVVGRIYAKQGVQVQLEWYPSAANLPLTLGVLDKNCLPLDSTTQTGNGIFAFTPSYSGWYTIRLRNATASQSGQHCWVKATYEAPAVVQTNEVKNKCACTFTEPGAELDVISPLEINLYPNPTSDQFTISLSDELQLESISLINVFGQSFQLSCHSTNGNEYLVGLKQLESGFYWVAIQTSQGSIYKSLQIVK
ncbi:MAG: T9SS type A sorting domain-containing protein [Cryomorphaceae bacterium]|jgi:alpha-amylase|nr:T9SS type A sorting domain-containing protein [Cryomorphaceae bacterium]